MELPVTVVIPTRDRAHLLPRALRSVLCQTWRPSEIIVVDDGSIDSTRALLRGAFPQVRYLSQPASGVSRARNLGIAKARSPWIALLDSDDAWLPQKLERQWRALRRDPHRLVHTDEIWVRNGRPVNQPKRQRQARSGGSIFEKCLQLCAISPSSALFEKALWWEIGGFDERLPACEDYDFWLRITCRYRVLYLDEPLLVKYGGHGDQLSRRVPALDRFRVFALCKLLAGGLPEAMRQAVLETVIQKANLYAQGAVKRGKLKEANRFERICRTALFERRLRWPSRPKPAP